MCFGAVPQKARSGGRVISSWTMGPLQLMCVAKFDDTAFADPMNAFGSCQLPGSETSEAAELSFLGKA